jgi:ribosomal protein S27AE
MMNEEKNSQRWCRECGVLLTTVQTRILKKQDATRRIKKCENCGLTVITSEHTEKIEPGTQTSRLKFPVRLLEEEGVITI